MTSEFKHHGKLATVSRELFSSWFAWIGIIIFLLLLAYIIGVPIYLAVNNIDVLSPIAGSNGNILNNATPSAQYIFGTDSFGNNMLLLIGVGVGTSLALAIAVTVLCTIIGTTLGIVGGAFSSGAESIFDQFLQVIVKILTFFPLIALFLIIYAQFVSRGNQINFGFIMLIFVISLWIPMYFNVRAQVIRIKNLEYNVASRILGTKRYKIILDYIPKVIPYVIVNIIFLIPSVIIAETSFGAIGFSLSFASGDVTLGNIIGNQSQLLATSPLTLLFPIIFILIITLSIQMIGYAFQNVFKANR